MNELIKTLSENVKPKYVKNYDNYQHGEFVQYSGQLWDDKEIYAAIDTLLNGAWVTAGEKVARFQHMFSRRFNVKHSHMVNSGSSANLVLITAVKKHLEWQDGDEIIVSPVGFPTTIAPIVQNGMKPVFIDIELASLNFDVSLIESAITEKTKAIFVSPVLGNPPNIDLLLEICKKHNLTLLGDNCDSLGTMWKDKLITDYYYAWTTSFYPAHHISTGEGGMVCTDDDELIATMRSVSWWGRDCYCVGATNLLECGTCGKRFDTWLNDYDGIIDHKYVFTNIGYNLKPLDLQGAIGLEQLKKFDMLESKRREYKLKIQEMIELNIKEVRVINAVVNSDPSWFGVPIFCESQEVKERLVKHFEDNKVQTRNYFAGNILLHPGYKHLDDFKKYPNSNLALSNVFFVGCSPLYNDKVLAYVEDVCKKWNS
ncbi:WecE Predicted pyridoxal phosphate-dependent enzyme apparently involved in regulation of cell wall biogenesis [uncultured Caudovirales phage]|uniref:WecE Predicted pyridoxal phosphate-dependent enzyme apparently involved in regulation of cell wall biogenesis n=1 Tax=uncultured Caudovirales phage TaxID=2100421 RepID=A0A6J5LFL8_9CAUD|nr:WecE Predicted pyridoxal phosphate-dependent enzyme apparently involved in regulation of cell wall biogenesis [uncultured Caudovirales phage]